MPDAAIFHYAGQIAAGPRNPDGLRDILFDLFGLPVTIEEFVGQWLELPADSTWKLGISPDTGRLGRTTVMGRSVWSRTNKFRIALGPLDPFGIESMLPHGADLEALRTIVRLYTNDEWAWDVALRLDASSIPPLRLGSGARLGWSTRLPGAAVGEQQLVVDPEKMLTKRLSAHRSSSPS
jgi:type VI secretion system protein ImpH